MSNMGSGSPGWFSTNFQWKDKLVKYPMKSLTFILFLIVIESMLEVKQYYEDYISETYNICDTIQMNNMVHVIIVLYAPYLRLMI